MFGTNDGVRTCSQGEGRTRNANRSSSYSSGCAVNGGSSSGRVLSNSGQERASRSGSGSTLVALDFSSGVDLSGERLSGNQFILNGSSVAWASGLLDGPRSLSLRNFTGVQLSNPVSQTSWLWSTAERVLVNRGDFVDGRLVAEQCGGFSRSREASDYGSDAAIGCVDLGSPVALTDWVSRTTKVGDVQLLYLCKIGGSSHCLLQV